MVLVLPATTDEMEGEVLLWETLDSPPGLRHLREIGKKCNSPHLYNEVKSLRTMTKVIKSSAAYRNKCLLRAHEPWHAIQTICLGR